MISKKMHNAQIIDFYNEKLNIDTVIDIFRGIGSDEIKKKTKLGEFENYILDYFYDGIRVNNV